MLPHPPSVPYCSKRTWFSRRPPPLLSLLHLSVGLLMLGQPCAGRQEVAREGRGMATREGRGMASLMNNLFGVRTDSSLIRQTRKK